MRKFTIEQYRKMSLKFNKMSFYDKIKTIKENKDILSLASDHNWWGVKVKDKYIQDYLSNNEKEFNIKKEWGYKEIYQLIEILGIDNTDI